MRTRRSFSLHLAALPLLVTLGLLAGTPSLLTAGSAPQADGRPREVHLWTARDVAPGPRIRLTINTRNVPVVHLAAYRLEGVRWLLGREKQEQPPRARPSRPRPIGMPVRAWDVTVASPRERPNAAQRDVYRSRQVNLPPLAPGVYLITGGGGSAEAWTVVNVTDLAIVVKRSPAHLLAWVCDAETGAPRAGAEVSLYDRRGRRLAAGSTRADGTALLAAAPGDEETVIVRRGQDLAGAPTAIEDPDGILTMHFQTDRPIYRPGQTVFYKAILRRTAGRGYVPAAGTACKVEARDAKENVLAATRPFTNDVGTLAGQVELPAEGVIGPYTVAVTIGKQTVYGSFSVAEYRKPEFRATVTAARRRYLAGEEVVCEVRASYYFGAPLPQAQVTYQVRRADAPYSASDDAVRWYAGGDGNLYPRDTYAATPFVAEGTVHTDETGCAVLRFKTDRAAPDSVYTIACTVTEASRREVRASAAVPVYAAALRLAVSTDRVMVPLGSVIPVRLKAADLDGKPAGVRVTLSVRQPVWIEKEGRYRDRELARTRVTIPAAGSAGARVPATAAGELEVIASALDATGRRTTAAFTIWVAGPRARTVRETAEPSVTVRLDRRLYRPGDTAQVWVSANTRGRPILVTAEGADLWQYRVVPAGKGQLLWDLKTSLAMSPNASISACQWAGSQLVSTEAVLPLPDESRRLTVQVRPDRATYRPGEEAGYVVRTIDAAGRPVSAEVAVSVVDEAIFALMPDTTPDPFRTFWGRRPNLTLTVSSAPEELSGGAYQRSNALAPVRERFLDTAFWRADVRTGTDGTARVTFPFPGNLTTWRTTARAITAETRAGATTASVQVSRPVMLRLAVPRQIVQGDHLTLVGTVHNRTERGREIEVWIAVQNLRVQGETRQRVRVPAGGERTVAWQLDAETLPESGTARIEGWAVAVDAPPDRREELSDALRVGVRVVPRGIAERIAVGSTLGSAKTVSFRLPEDRIEPATEARLTVRAGLRQALEAAARGVLDTRGDGSVGAADRLLTAVALGNRETRAARDAVAQLSRYQASDGAWGWWDDTPPEASITARALLALSTAKAAGISVSNSLLQRGIAGAGYHYGQTDLWEDRALLAAAVVIAGGKEGLKLLEEVRRRGTHLSPFARLLLAEALLHAGDSAAAAVLAREQAAALVTGPETAYLSAGEHPGWSATTAETTAELLIVLSRLSRDAELQRRLAAWLARPEEDGDRCPEDEAWTVRALAEYARRHPDPVRLGTLEVSCNGVRLDVLAPAGNRPVSVVVPRSVLRSGENTLALRRDGAGEVFVSVDARVYRPVRAEAAAGMRVLRRFDVRNAAGLWEELDGPVPPAAPVRCTVVVWPDDRPDRIRVTEPIPTGCEFVDSDSEACAREEVRDGAVIHYLQGSGRPVTFRYYLRAESEGRVAALPAVGEVLRRPAVRGNSAAGVLDIHAGEDRTKGSTAETQRTLRTQRGT